MVDKPKCDCWQDPDMAQQRELQIDGLGQAIQHAVDMAVREMNICAPATPYVAGSVVAGIVFWVAYMLRGDGSVPTGEQVAKAELEVLLHSRERLDKASQIRDPTDILH